MTCRSGCGNTNCYVCLYYPREARVAPLALCAQCGFWYESARAQGMGWREALKYAIKGGKQ